MSNRVRQVAWRPPESLAEDHRRLHGRTAMFLAGQITAEQFRADHVPMGIYPQRREGLYMVRNRVPAGVLLPEHMKALADVSARYGNGVLHVTTRQDVQVHGVKVGDLNAVLTVLREGGLSTKGGCGDAVRNVVACPEAGVCETEAFDVTPYAVAMTDFLVGQDSSFKLPRKYKIAFSGCPKDCGGAGVNDLGLIATRRDGVEGFIVYVGGGLGSQARVADLLEPFVPASEVFSVAEAVKRVFSRHGDRKNRRTARLRHLIRRIGLDEFRLLYEHRLAEVHSEQLAPPTVHQPSAPQISEPAKTDAKPPPGFEDWRRVNVTAQKQAGYWIVHISLVLSDIEAARLRDLADVAAAFGEGMVRATARQDMLLRWVHDNELGAVFARLGEIGLADARPPLPRDMVVCTGAETCRLGIGRTHPLARAIADALAEAKLDLATLGELKLHVSGCPNMCGRHAVAQIGLFGGKRRVNGRSAPFYFLQLGGRIDERGVRFAEGRWAIPARNVPVFLASFLTAFAGSEESPDFEAFLEGDGRRLADSLTEQHAAGPISSRDEIFFHDWGTAGAESV